MFAEQAELRRYTEHVIDKYAPDRPVFLRRYDGHMGVANTRALKLAGITAPTLVLQGDRDEAGAARLESRDRGASSRG